MASGSGEAGERRCRAVAKTRRKKNDSSPRGGSRAECTLGLLTKGFLKLIAESRNGVVDLKEASATLNVAKRRVYDITNVLEGVGLISKMSANYIMWQGGPLSGASTSAGLGHSGSTQQQGMGGEGMKELEALEAQLDAMVSQTQHQIQELVVDPCNRDCLYVTEQDLANVDAFKRQIILAIRAPSGSAMEVMDPSPCLAPGVPNSEKPCYSLVLKSDIGPVEVFLVNTTSSEAADSHEAEAGLELHSCVKPHSVWAEESLMDRFQSEKKVPGGRPAKLRLSASDTFLSGVKTEGPPPDDHAEGESTPNEAWRGMLDALHLPMDEYDNGVQEGGTAELDDFQRILDAWPPL